MEEKKAQTLQKEMLALPSVYQMAHAYNLTAKKNLGQHFLFDLNLTDRIARAAGSLSNYTIIEIGPGPGGLTRSLLINKVKKLIVIERDERCINLLQDIQNIVGVERLEIIEADALKVNEAELANGPTKIIANLPYNIATELLFKWLDIALLFESMTLMFQKEVADRIIAKPFTKAYGRVSVMTQWLCEVRHDFDVRPEAFTPPPKVMSSVITLTPRKKPFSLADKQMLEKLCQAVFGQRRKMLRGSLKQLVKNPEEILERASISPTSRPEELSVEEFCILAQALG